MRNIDKFLHIPDLVSDGDEEEEDEEEKVEDEVSAEIFHWQ